MARRRKSLLNELDDAFAGEVQRARGEGAWHRGLARFRRGGGPMIATGLVLLFVLPKAIPTAAGYAYLCGGIALGLGCWRALRGRRR